jgi:N-sulfoglucosamine sulfohydrolase
MANAHDPHRPFHNSEAEREVWTAEQRATYPSPSRVFDGDEVDVPAFLPGLRTEYADYLSSSRRCDELVAAVLDELDAAAMADDTLVVFLSDMAWPSHFAKANCYLRSTLTPLIVRWPGVTTPGTSDQTSFVNCLDLSRPSATPPASPPRPGSTDQA